jgi:hypothetical protein
MAQTRADNPAGEETENPPAVPAVERRKQSG